MPTLLVRRASGLVLTGKPELIEIYLLHEKKLAPGSVENCVSALRFLYKRTLKRRDLAFDDLPFPKQPRSLPIVLSQEEVTPADRGGTQPDASHHP